MPERSPTTARLARIASTIVIALVCLVLGYLVRAWFTPPPEPAATDAAAADSDVRWTCSMHPQVDLSDPGLCPICHMDLIPRQADTGDDKTPRTFRTSAAGAALMNLEVTPVERRFVTAEVRMVGTIEYDETRLAHITAWVPGRLDDLFVDYTGVMVRPGDHLVSIYSPELISAQEELLQAWRAANAEQGDRVLREVAQKTMAAARDKLRLLGLKPEQIEAIEQRGAPTDHLTIYAPIGGIVVDKPVVEGMYVQTGTRIYTIADLSAVWVVLDAYESDLPWLRYGQEVEFTTIAHPGQVFRGTVAFIDPLLRQRNRTVRVRVNADNSEGLLKPGMFVRAVVRTQVATGGRVMEPHLAGKWICPMHPDVIDEHVGDCTICGMPLVTTESLGYVAAEPRPEDMPLVIPVSAALVTGTRAVVYVEDTEAERPTFRGREIVLGPRAGDYYLVRTGLAEGEWVVTRGNFKIDSALQLSAQPSMMSPAAATAAMPAGHHHDHGPIAEPASGPRVDAAHLPAMFRHELFGVAAAAQDVTTAVNRADLAAIRAAFAQLQATIEAIDAADLADDAAQLWREHHLRLRNDAVEGAAVTNLGHAGRVERMLTRNVMALRRAFQLPTEPPYRWTARLSAEQRAVVEPVLEAYLQVRAALAEDDFSAAGDAFDRLRNAAQAAAAAPTPAADLLGNLAAATESPPADIEALRRSFTVVSEALLALFREFGPVVARPLYVMNCPMAFNNRGANWFQADPELRNPYFGAMMLRCGTTDAVIPSATSP